ncbi:MAG: tryptophan--tRNA ligase [Bdellovibrionota bacterium]|jgi:tryptophanyl-tRNA synthetase
MTKKILLTGIRASGDIHLGNYLGAMKPALENQENYQCFLFIADYHGLTTSPPPEELRKRIYSCAAAWLASGLDPEKTTIWRQSDVPEVLELAYVLSCVTSTGLLDRGHSVKDARAKGQVLKAGLFYYPVLMAADILLYEADLVPVGKDQLQHLEMTRDMATFFNETYGELFKLPQAKIQDEIAVVPGVDGQKMSKSYDNGIEIFAPEKVLKKQIMRIISDSKTLEEPKDPNDCLIYKIYRLVASPEKAEKMAAQLRAGNYGYGHAKTALFEEIMEIFQTQRKKFDHYMSHPSEIDAILQHGAAKAQEKAKKMISQVRQRVGL